MPDGYDGQLLFGVVGEDGRVGELQELHGSIELEPDEHYPMYAPYEVMRPFRQTYTARIEDPDVMRSLVVGEVTRRVDLAFERLWRERQMPRTVREAKARRKGNRGNQRRRRVEVRQRTIVPNVSVEPTFDYPIDSASTFVWRFMRGGEGDGRR